MSRKEAAVHAVIFDCDGTLVDSEELGLEVLARHAREAGVVFPPGQEIESLRGKSMPTCLRLFGELLGRPLRADFEARLRAAMADAFRERLQPMPGAREVLDALRVPSCVATNGPRSKAELTLGLTGLLPRFHDRIFCAPEVGAYKPDPGLFLAAALALGVAPSNCLVVEDSAPGMEAAVRAGMRVATVRCPRPVPLHLAQRVEVVERLVDLLRLPGLG